MSLHPSCIETSGNTKMQMLKENKNPHLFVIEKKLLKTYQLVRKLVILATFY